MSDQQTKSVLRLPVGDLVKAGANAPAVLVHEVVQRRGPKLLAEAESHRCSADFDVEKYVDRLVKSQLMLVRGQGALAGLAVIASEALAASETVASVGAAVPVALSGIAVTVIADLATLSYFQIELSLKIAAAYGHDLTDYETRGREILHLHGLEMLGGQTLAPVVGRGASELESACLCDTSRATLLRPRSRCSGSRGSSSIAPGWLRCCLASTSPLGLRSRMSPPAARRIRRVSFMPRFRPRRPSADRRAESAVPQPLASIGPNLGRCLT